MLLHWVDFCFGIGYTESGMKLDSLNLIEKTAFGKRLLRDVHFRAMLFAVFGMGWNLIYALFNGVMGIVYRSYWFWTLFAYYAALAVMRFYIVNTTRKKRPRRTLIRLLRRIGIGLIGLSIVVSGIVILSVFSSVAKSYSLVMMLTIATFTFFLIVKAVMNIHKARKSGVLSLILLRNISLASAIVSILSLERSMLETFGTAGSRLTGIMIPVSGGVAVLLIAFLGVSMVLAASELLQA